MLRRVISTQTAASLTGIMEAVVERGTAKASRIEGYSVAGKTGTAAKLVNRYYSRTRLQRLVRRVPAVAGSPRSRSSS